MNDSDGDYASILRRIIDDPKYNRLPATARFVWLTLLIIPDFKVLGIAPLDLPVLSRRTGLAKRPTVEALAALERAGVIRRDGLWCWIKNHLRYQQGFDAWRKSRKTILGLSRRLANLPTGLAFLPEFLQVYSDLGFSFDLPPRLRDTPIDKDTDTPIDTPIDLPEPEPEPEPENLTRGTTKQHMSRTEAVAAAAARRKVFDHWREVMGKPNARLDEKRRKAIDARLRDGYSVEDLCRAVYGCRRSAWHQGANERGRRYDDLELICRDSKHVDQFLDIAANGEPRPMSRTTAHNLRALGMLDPDAPPALPEPEDK